MIIVLMGVAGSGKTTIGHRLAEELEWVMIEGDDLHSPSNVAKMSAGIPLTDSDREPWLEAIAQRIHVLSFENRSAIITCSALKQSYRDRLVTGARPDEVTFVYLRVPMAVAEKRLASREGHFMPESLLPSQFAALEEPVDGVVVDGSQPPGAIVRLIRERLRI
jgi:gluconokinase